MASVDTWWTRLSLTAKRNLAVGGIGTVVLAVSLQTGGVTRPIYDSWFSARLF